ncbi:MAG: DUF5069 domain-containing protein [Verrucomicrobiota bacterium JB022]|nr:DUF5069 domain-containing protein [Verrucomicrobiota bacterium JB022]
MKNYDYQKRLRGVWEHAVKLYEEGNRDSSTYFEGEQLEFVRSIGATPQEIYDFAEDWCSGQEPDYSTFALLADIRRYYFLVRQKSKPTGKVLDPATLPPKDSSVRGIDWLPRILPKAKAKLRGELSHDIMYGCGGDRRFFKTNDIHPAEFLRVVMDNENDDTAIVNWVEGRTKGKW